MCWLPHCFYTPAELLVPAHRATYLHATVPALDHLTDTWSKQRRAAHGFVECSDTKTAATWTCRGSSATA